MPPHDTKCSPAEPVAAVYDRRPPHGRVGSPSGPNLQATQSPSPFRIPHSAFPILHSPTPSLLSAFQRFRVSAFSSPPNPSRLRAFAGNPSSLRHPSSALGGSAASAFTLLEVLVASAIMGIVMFVLVSTANTSLQLWRGTSEKIAKDREGRTGLALLAWDLQNIVQPTNLTLRPWINTNNVIGSPSGQTVLRFLTLKPADYQTDPATDLGDVCYVEYRYTNNSLARAFVSSSNTFAALTNSTPAFPSPPDSAFQTLVPNVWSFKFWGIESTNTNVAYNPSNGEQSSPAQTLRSVEYRLGLLDQKHMRLHRADPTSLPAQVRDSSIRWYQAIQPVLPPAP
jgi:prepilin-type N-terminal cleavage/methylation domain-containing protein